MANLRFRKARAEPIIYTDVAQLVESHSDTVVVSGSSPLISTNFPEVQGGRVDFATCSVRQTFRAFYYADQ